MSARVACVRLGTGLPVAILAALALLVPAASAAQPARPPQPVDVVNDPLDPVPVTIQGGASMEGVVPVEVQEPLATTEATPFFNERLTINALCDEGDDEDLCPFVMTSEPVLVPEGKTLVIEFVSAFPGSSSNAELMPTLSIRVGGSLLFLGRVGPEGLAKKVVIPTVNEGTPVDRFSASLSFSATGSRPEPTGFGGASGPTFQQIIRATGRIVDAPPSE